jgi:fumarate reductase flavoprotein subunit
VSAIPTAVDVVVAGSGATGLAAAVTLAEGGARVAVFEKQRALGGTSNFFHGTFAVESSLQRERYVDYSRDEAFHNIMEYSHWRANARLVRAIVDESAPTIGWLQERGVEFTGQMVNMPGAPSTYHVIKGDGEAVIKALAARAKSNGVQILPGTPVVALAKNEGRPAGVIVEDDGREVEVASGAVVIATGGYVNNRDWIKKYNGHDLGVSLFAVGNTGKMGDGIRMVWEAGGAVDGLDALELVRVAPMGPEFAMGNDIEFLAMQPDLYVDARGRRFCDESVAFYDTHSGNANARFKDDGHTFSLFDDSIIARVLENGVDRALTIDRPPGYKPKNVWIELQAALDHGSTEVLAASSVEELAVLMGVDPPDSLVATVDEYNAFCVAGHDDLFAKPARLLRPLTGPRYYAVKARTVCLGTKGGVKVNECLEALDKRGAVIPGLYAGGFDAGGMYGDSYPIRVSSGLSSAFAVNSGRIAGRSALRYLGL